MKASPQLRRAWRPGLAPSQQRGVLLLEALIAILIFSLGILGVVGLQAASIKQATAAEDRAKAASLANDLISRMWASNHTTLSTNFGATGDGFTRWMETVEGSQLPGVKDSDTLKPTISFTDGPTSATGIALSTQAKIIIKWQAPNESTAHQYTAIAVIK
ncbi:type IV pilus modification protein PilV [Comamonas sp. JUb58]|uniref:type IV pilus modification protein PilV n=1 Tax=Comamonas sp. JUb58 TaxID=2485114 RepID=UPI001060ED22|nr:type IV pilus modification protein PilV [Comamonas sp. JUb58]TDS83239.1 type IV pilus assembly protein PilV [Comamonas sp. JUb58]